MPRDFYLFNTLSRKKECFRPSVPGHLGLYVCGPTVYGDPHLGHARPAITYDVLVRLFRHLGYKVRYVRNITDVGHLVDDADQGEDKIERRARIEKIEPMEVAQYYTVRYHRALERLRCLPPSIEPRASGHIFEQIAMVQQILDAGFAYVNNGSVYFDVEAYDAKYSYGRLSGRVLEHLQAHTRSLEGQDDKRSPYDFALWKKASPEHIMHWPSPWSEGVPGWHVECSAMGAKYLGDAFDIHGGGMDLLFPHHECELAQNTVTRGADSVRYWMHNNLITINGQKMGKSLGNVITLDELFTGKHALLHQAFDPMTVRFFILQAHYRGPLDFSNEALLAAEKGLKRLFEAGKALRGLPVLSGPAGAGATAGAAATAAAADAPSPRLAALQEKIYEALCDDLNTPVALSCIFDMVKFINTAADRHTALTPADKRLLESVYDHLIGGVLGLYDEQSEDRAALIDGLAALILDLRSQAKQAKDWATSDKIRERLQALGLTVKDSKEGSTWSY